MSQCTGTLLFLLLLIFYRRNTNPSHCSYSNHSNHTSCVTSRLHHWSNLTCPFTGPPPVYLQCLYLLRTLFKKILRLLPLSGDKWTSYTLSSSQNNLPLQILSTLNRYPLHLCIPYYFFTLRSLRIPFYSRFRSSLIEMYPPSGIGSTFSNPTPFMNPTCVYMYPKIRTIVFQLPWEQTLKIKQTFYNPHQCKTLHLPHPLPTT